MHIRPLMDDDIPAVISIFQDAICHIASRDYNADQLRAWVQHVDDREAFLPLMRQGMSLIAEDHWGAVAFGQLHPADHINYLYCRHAVRGKAMRRAFYALRKRRRGAMAFTSCLQRPARRRAVSSRNMAIEWSKQRSWSARGFNYATSRCRNCCVTVECQQRRPCTASTQTRLMQS